MFMTKILSKMVLLHIKKTDDLQMLVMTRAINQRQTLTRVLLQVEVPAATPLAEAIPHVAKLWNTMLRMRKLADCCNDLATYLTRVSATSTSDYIH
jgi:hypothetical protein